MSKCWLAPSPPTAGTLALPAVLKNHAASMVLSAPKRRPRAQTHGLSRRWVLPATGLPPVRPADRWPARPRPASTHVVLFHTQPSHLCHAARHITLSCTAMCTHGSRLKAPDQANKRCLSLSLHLMYLTSAKLPRRNYALPHGAWPRGSTSTHRNRENAPIPAIANRSAGTAGSANDSRR